MVKNFGKRDSRVTCKIDKILSIVDNTLIQHETDDEVWDDVLYNRPGLPKLEAKYGDTSSWTL